VAKNRTIIHPFGLFTAWASFLHYLFTLLDVLGSPAGFWGSSAPFTNSLDSPASSDSAPSSRLQTTRIGAPQKCLTLPILLETRCFANDRIIPDACLWIRTLGIYKNGDWGSVKPLPQHGPNSL